MARTSCASCGNKVSYSDPAFERLGIKSNAWANLVRQTGFLCLDCLASSDCVKCGATLGSRNATVNGHSYDSGTYCGQPTCILCTKDRLQSGAELETTSAAYTSSSRASSNSWERKGFFGRVLFILGVAILWFIMSLFIVATEVEILFLLIWLPGSIYLGYRAIKMLFLGR